MITVPHVYEARAVRLEHGRERVIAHRYFRCETGDPKNVGRRALQKIVRGRFLMKIRPATPTELGMRPLPERLVVSA